MATFDFWHRFNCLLNQRLRKQNLKMFPCFIYAATCTRDRLSQCSDFIFFDSLKKRFRTLRLWSSVTKKKVQTFLQILNSQKSYSHFILLENLRKTLILFSSYPKQKWHIPFLRSWRRCYFSLKVWGKIVYATRE